MNFTTASKFNVPFKKKNSMSESGIEVPDAVLALVSEQFSDKWLLKIETCVLSDPGRTRLLQE